MITNVDTAPGISDYEVILFDITIQSSVVPDKMAHSVYLYHKGDLNKVKQDMCVFKDSFKSSNPECNSVDAKWNSFKEALANSISRHIPKKKIKARKDLSWITHDIKKTMKHRRQLYDYAKQYNTEESWSSYRKARNKVNIMVQSAHERYCTRILDTNFPGQQHQF